MRPRPHRSTRNATLRPYTTLFRPPEPVEGRFASGGALRQALASARGGGASASCPPGGERERGIGEQHRRRNRERIGGLLRPEPVDRLKQREQRREHPQPAVAALRSEEHTSELQSLMRISYAVFCLKKKTT